jgi:ABC-2 type transport system ATP-binding protein
MRRRAPGPAAALVEGLGVAPHQCGTSDRSQRGVGTPTLDDVRHPAAIETTALTRRFGATTAVDALELRVSRGEVVGLLGHNGAGKTTTVRLLNGVLSPSAGGARVLGLDPWRDGVALRRRTGVGTETPAVDDRLTGRQGLTLFAEIYGVPRERVTARVSELLEEFELAAAADQRVASYSRGMKQRLSLARTLLHEPELLFLDEPTTGLDPVAARAMDDRITALRASGVTVLLCTHNLVQAQALCDRVIVLEHGRVVASGTPAELAAGLGAGTRVTVELEAPGGVDAVALLAEAPGAHDVELAGEAPARLRFTADDRDAVATVVARLVAAGVRVFAVERDAATLEDVYFALHARGESHARGEAPASTASASPNPEEATA